MTAAALGPIATEIDPFDLPEWLGEGEVCWSSDAGIDGHLVAGVLDGGGGRRIVCDLLAVDQAYPAPVIDEGLRRRVHQVWQHGQVLVVQRDGRATVTAPGAAYDAELVITAITRAARALGADPRLWSVRLGLCG